MNLKPGQLWHWTSKEKEHFFRLIIEEVQEVEYGYSRVFKVWSMNHGKSCLSYIEAVGYPWEEWKLVV